MGALARVARVESPQSAPRTWRRTRQPDDLAAQRHAPVTASGAGRSHVRQSARIDGFDILRRAPRAGSPLPRQTTAAEALHGHSHPRRRQLGRRSGPDRGARSRWRWPAATRSPPSPPTPSRSTPTRRAWSPPRSRSRRADRKIPGYLARPAAKGKHPVVFVNSEVFGVHEWVKDICRRLAKAGYVALAPDLFVRAGDPSKTTDFKVVMDIVQGASRRRRCLGDTAASLKFLAAQPFADMKRLGVTGFCWGGGATWRCCETLPRVQGRRRLVRPAEGRRLSAQGADRAVKDLKAPGARPLRRPGQGHPADGRRGHARGAEGGRQERTRSSSIPTPSTASWPTTAPATTPTAAEDGWAKMLAFFKAHGVA